MSKFGLIGKNIDYSFSKSYFTNKFEKENLEHTYENFDLENINQVHSLLKSEGIKGLNVTIPYKKAIIPYLDEIDSVAQKIGAVNTIKFLDNGKTKGFNTDYIGFSNSLQQFLPLQHNSALILGTGGASDAVAFALKLMDFKIAFVSRNISPPNFLYNELDKEIIKDHPLIINTTPLGTFPNISESPNIPYEYLTKNHLLYDLIYNPSETSFLLKGKKRGAKTFNGLEMLINQAEEAWKIWSL